MSMPSREHTSCLTLLRQQFHTPRVSGVQPTTSFIACCPCPKIDLNVNGVQGTAIPEGVFSWLLFADPVSPARPDIMLPRVLTLPLLQQHNLALILHQYLSSHSGTVQQHASGAAANAKVASQALELLQLLAGHHAGPWSLNVQATAALALRSLNMSQPQQCTVSPYGCVTIRGSNGGQPVLCQYRMSL